MTNGEKCESCGGKDSPATEMKGERTDMRYTVFITSLFNRNLWGGRSRCPGMHWKGKHTGRGSGTTQGHARWPAGEDRNHLGWCWFPEIGRRETESLAGNSGNVCGWSHAGTDAEGNLFLSGIGADMMLYVLDTDSVSFQQAGRENIIRRIGVW